MTTPQLRKSEVNHAAGKGLPALPESRLVALCDGRMGLRSALTVKVQSPAGSAEGALHNATGPNAAKAPRPVLDFVASNETLDRYHEIIVASGWRLENYRRNPVFQNAHQYGDILFTIGKALITEVRGAELFQRVEFATEVNPMARIAYGLYQGGFLNAVSVGFIPLRWVGPDGAEHGPGLSGLNSQSDTTQTGFRRKYLEQELLEVSAVGIPANPDALQLALRAGAIQKTDLKEASALLQVLVSASTGAPNGSPAGRAWEEARQLAAEIRKVLQRA
jgi:hypothetical protein